MADHFLPKQREKRDTGDPDSQGRPQALKVKLGSGAFLKPIKVRSLVVT